jgi:hypothetical protein
MSDDGCDKVYLFIFQSHNYSYTSYGWCSALVLASHCCGPGSIPA